ncbi:MAG: dienelactone hydrolase [Chitinophagaceae bacterium]|nr:dienelactone hydrolase [Chitinophagaceae bacterium]
MAFAACVAMSLSSYGQKTISYVDNKDVLSGYFAKAKSEKKNTPGVVVIPAWMGGNEHTKHSADELSALGYHAFVADIYGEGKNPKSPAEAKELSSYYKNNPEIYQRRIKAAIDQLIKQGADANSIAVIGYCFGGTGALEAARAGLPVKGVVSFHGGLGKDTARANTPITAKVLVLHGADDPYVPQAQVTAFQDEMRKSKADWQMIYYANAVHAFTEISAGNDNSKGAAYNEAAAKRSWEHMTLFFADLLK